MFILVFVSCKWMFVFGCDFKISTATALFIVWKWQCVSIHSPICIMNLVESRQTGVCGTTAFVGIWTGILNRLTVGWPDTNVLLGHVQFVVSSPCSVATQFDVTMLLKPQPPSCSTCMIEQTKGYKRGKREFPTLIVRSRHIVFYVFCKKFEPESCQNPGWKADSRLSCWGHSANVSLVRVEVDSLRVSWHWEPTICSEDWAGFSMLFSTVKMTEPCATVRIDGPKCSKCLIFCILIWCSEALGAGNPEEDHRHNVHAVRSHSVHGTSSDFLNGTEDGMTCFVFLKCGYSQCFRHVDF